VDIQNLITNSVKIAYITFRNGGNDSLHFIGLTFEIHRDYFKRAVQPKCEVQGANCAVQNWKMSSPKISTFHLWWTEMSLINDKTMYIDIEAK
jgi:hypothetical protein